MKTQFLKMGITGVVVVIPFISFCQNVGLGTSAPKAKVQVAALSSDSVAFKVSVNGANKLKVFSNGGTTVGSDDLPLVNGLSVRGVIEPNDSIKNSSRPIYIVSTQDSLVLLAGTTTIVLSSNGAVKIKAANAGGITLDAGIGNVNIKGGNINLDAGIGNVNIKGGNINMDAAIGNVNIKGGNTNLEATYGTATLKGIIAIVKGTAQTQVTGSQIIIGNGSASPYKQAARLGDMVVAPGGVGTIVTASNTVLLQ